MQFLLPSCITVYVQMQSLSRYNPFMNELDVEDRLSQRHAMHIELKSHNTR